jgi:hypothetical protein
MEHKLNENKNIIGVSSLIDDYENSDYLLEIEKNMINGPSIEEEENINAQQFKREIEDLSKKCDFTLEGNEYEEELNDNIFINDDDDNEIIRENNNMNNMNNINNNINFSSNSYGGGFYRPQNQYQNYDIQDNQLRNMTMEQKKQNYINNALQDISYSNDQEFDIDKEKEEDDKNSLLEQIDMLKMNLEDEGLDISKIPEVNKDSSFNDIQNVYKILILKNDRNRYCSFAEELILSAAYGLEELFDGEKEWFGKQPDLTGWHKTVQLKLRRCRYQTTNFVKDIMQDYNMSSGLRLAIELIPSMFLYSRQKKIPERYNINNDYDNAFSKLNSL